jgi:hypothetical protein
VENVTFTGAETYIPFGIPIIRLGKNMNPLIGGFPLRKLTVRRSRAYTDLHKKGCASPAHPRQLPALQTRANTVQHHAKYQFPQTSQSARRHSSRNRAYCRALLANLAAD